MATRKKKGTTKRKTTHKKGTRKMRGRGVGSTILSGLRYIKDNKLISRGLGLIPNPGAQAAAQLASMAGLGRRRKKRTTRKKGMRGGGIFSDLGGGLGSAFGGLGSGIGSIAHGLFGAGRKKGTRMHLKVRPGFGIRL